MNNQSSFHNTWPLDTSACHPATQSHFLKNKRNAFRAASMLPLEGKNVFHPLMIPFFAAKVCRLSKAPHIAFQTFCYSRWQLCRDSKITTECPHSEKSNGVPSFFPKYWKNASETTWKSVRLQNLFLAYPTINHPLTSTYLSYLILNIPICHNPVHTTIMICSRPFCTSKTPQSHKESTHFGPCCTEERYFRQVRLSNTIPRPKESSSTDQRSHFP